MGEMRTLRALTVVETFQAEAEGRGAAMSATTPRRIPLWRFSRAERLSDLAEKLRQAEREIWWQYVALGLAARRAEVEQLALARAALAERGRVLRHRRQVVTAALRAAGGAVIQPGDRFGRLVVQAPLPPIRRPYGRQRLVWQCRCDCGRVVPVRAEELTKVKDSARSCGCQMGRRS